MSMGIFRAPAPEGFQIKFYSIDDIDIDMKGRKGNGFQFDGGVIKHFPDRQGDQLMVLGSAFDGGYAVRDKNRVV